MDKEHVGDGVQGDTLIGEVRPILIGFDDMIASAGTTREFCNVAAKNKTIERMYYIASHGIFVGDANKNLAHDNLYKLIISDTIDPFRLSIDILNKTVILSTIDMTAQAIKRTYTGESLSDLFN